MEFFVKIYVLISLEKLDLSGNCWVDMPIRPILISFDSWEHALLVQTFISHKIPYIKSYPCTLRQSIRYGLEMKPMHMSISIRVWLQIQVILMGNFFNLRVRIIILWFDHASKGQILLHWDFNHFHQIATFKPGIKLQVLQFILRLHFGNDQILP